MDPSLLDSLLRPFLAVPLQPADLAAIADYLDLLLRWNAKINLTAVREPNNIVTRHIGESLFAAQCLLGSREATGRVIDFGSGAGFPGLPLRLYAPGIKLTLIESNQKKVAFLREAARTMGFGNVDVFSGMAEDYTGRGDLVTMRAVESFEASLSVAAGLMDRRDDAKLGLLIGMSQIASARVTMAKLDWGDAIKVPECASRVVLIGRRQ
jgi:16S rRNA (guanine527-N7)-methyltransferase